MSIKIKTIAILSPNQAFASILRVILANNKGLRVRLFSDEVALSQYINIAPIDLLIIDNEKIDYQTISTISFLQNNYGHANNFHIIVLGNKIERGISAFCNRVNISQIIIKPASPSFLEERILAILDGAIRARKPNIRQNIGRNDKAIDPTLLGDNIIALFGKERAPNPNLPNN